MFLQTHLIALLAKAAAGRICWCKAPCMSSRGTGPAPFSVMPRSHRNAPTTWMFCCVWLMPEQLWETAALLLVNFPLIQAFSV